ncbi:hypothetical protein KDA_77010 [Dictyobacter alpinus]|uniref:Uncharacterized protein n=1 Tax=Dictyobacter alpinus TaxID=2014873 RepID=A0A402BLI8_9CHLR|nr:hypothetical protein [Dictyobacter alpinus]GCE32217.1 hypothetical protein KDA_77010 [Dictyobacter alpinus]
MSKEQIQQPQATKLAPTQCAMILCLKRMVNQLVDELVDLLEQHTEDPSRVRVISYGITQKCHDGFMVLECLGGFPQEFVSWLRVDNDVESFVIYDCGSTQPEQEESSHE